MFATIAARYEIPIIACAASSESVFDQNSGYLFGTLSPNAGLFSPMVKYFRDMFPSLKLDEDGFLALGREDVTKTREPMPTRTAQEKPPRRAKH